jgi:hypothetical protein
VGIERANSAHLVIERSCEQARDLEVVFASASSGIRADTLFVYFRQRGKEKAGVLEDSVDDCLQVSSNREDSQEDYRRG